MRGSLVIRITLAGLVLLPRTAPIGYPSVIPRRARRGSTTMTKAADIPNRATPPAARRISHIESGVRSACAGAGDRYQRDAGRAQLAAAEASGTALAWHQPKKRGRERTPRRGARICPGISPAA
jgi:hypothetical protein